MKIIDEFPMKIFVVARGKRGCNGTGVCATFDCGSAIDLRWQYISRSGGFDFEIGNQEHKMQSRRNLETLHGLTARHRETTESGRRRVVGMSFELRTQLQDRQSIKRISGQSI